MKIKAALPILLICTAFTSTKDVTTGTKLQAFDDLLGTWVIKVEAGEVEFNQKINFRKDLNGYLIHTTSYKLNDEKKWEKNGNGVRYYDQKSRGYQFIEWTNDGDKVVGSFQIKGDSIFYQYPYQGNTFRDLWVKKDSNTYAFMVGTIRDNTWDKLYLDAEALRQEE